jgi:plastocyanin
VQNPTTTPTAETTIPTGKIVPKDITIASFQFSPATMEIAVGETAQWINNDNAPHVIVADDNSFQSPTLQAGESFNFTFVQAGTFNYHCSIHPSMKGTISVK